MVIRIFAPESFSWKAISSAVYSELIGLITQPAAAIPWKTTGYQGVLGQRTATTSPLRSPLAARAAATRSTYPASWPWVMTSPLRPSIRAGASGRSRPAARTNSGTETSGISTSGYGLVSATKGPPRF